MKPVFLRKISDRRGNSSLLVAVAEGADAKRPRDRYRLVRTCHRRAAQLRCGLQWCDIRRCRAVDHGGEAAEAGLRNFPQYQVVGGKLLFEVTVTYRE